VFNSLDTLGHRVVCCSQTGRPLEFGGRLPSIERFTGVATARV